MPLKDVTLRLVQPRHEEELVAHADAMQRVREGRLQDDRRVGCTLAALSGRVHSVSERGADDADGDEHEPVVHLY